MPISLRNRTINRLTKLINRTLTEAKTTPAPLMAARLAEYFTELEHWNHRINLTGIKSKEEMVFKHLGDTLVLAHELPANTGNLLDIGTGAGVPGLLLKILRPELDVVLVDAARKKISFLRTVIAKTGLEGIRAEHGRVGAAGVPARMPPGGFDLITSRALGSIRCLLEMALPLLSPAGIIAAMKGPGGPKELEENMESVREKDLKTKILEKRLPILGHRRCLIFLQRVHHQEDA